jgi:hypothetical protein
VVEPGKAGDHKRTCSQHVEPTLDLGSRLPDLFCISGIQSTSPAPAAPSLLRPAATGSSRCAECGNHVMGNLAFFHKATCSRYSAALFGDLASSRPAHALRKPPAPPPATTCEECGNAISAADGSGHGLICSKHPGYARSQPSRLRNVRFMPLTDPDPEPAPTFDLSESPYLLGDRCAECKKFVLPGSLTLKHAPWCSKRKAGV